MPQSLCQIYVHLTFSTKNRTPNLIPAVHEPLRAYLGGILRGLESPSLEIGCTDDHVHILYTHDKNTLIPDLIMHVKKDSSKWLKTQGPRFAQFHWQAGYGAFSVSASRIPAVKRYITDQPAHHRTDFSFQDEFRKFLKEYHIQYDERYVWD